MVLRKSEIMCPVLKNVDCPGQSCYTFTLILTGIDQAYTGIVALKFEPGKQKKSLKQCFRLFTLHWVEDGIRTRDTLNHNQVLYH